jgi:uncharacterized repeat protein (TIGR03803 family)
MKTLNATNLSIAKLPACLLISVLAMSTAQAAVHFQILHNFGDGPDDGRAEDGGVIIASDGRLYGTTGLGGSYRDILGQGQGTVFKLNEDGDGYVILQSFLPYPEPHVPVGGVIEGSDGALYGVAATSGNEIVWWQPGGIYKLNKDGSGFVMLHLLGDPGPTAYSALVEGDDGMLYGMNTTGVFKLNKDGSGFGLLHGVETAADGDFPLAGLLEGTDGALYGTTSPGGTNGSGTVFKLNKDGSGYQILHNFNNDDLGTPRARLIEASDGRLYGTTSPRTSSTCAVFGLNKDGSSYRVLLTYDDPVDQAGLVEGRDGALYGTRFSGMDFTVFRLNKDGTAYRELYHLNNSGSLNYLSALVPGNDGAFYGTSLDGGPDLVFKVWPPETPDMLGVANVNGSIQVRFAGEAGARYQVLRSSDLVTWIALPPITMPASGTYLYTDTAPTTGLAFYRAAWLP